MPRKNARVDAFVLEALRLNPSTPKDPWVEKRAVIAGHRMHARAARQQARYDVEAAGVAEYHDAEAERLEAELEAAGHKRPRGARYRKNPLDYLDATPGQNTKTEAFKRWFKGSKVVDQTGAPLVVFHGTDNGGFYAFNRGESVGLFFASNQELAESYVNAPRTIAGDEYDDPTPTLFSSFEEFLRKHERWAPLFEVEKMGGGYKVFFDGDHVIDFMPDSDDEEEFLAAVNSQTTRQSGVYAVYLRIENPFIVNARGENWDEIMMGGKKYTTNELVMLAESDGSYDGVIIKNVGDSGGGGTGYQDERGTVFIVFDPKQIKSYDNIGTFDPTTADIRRNARQNPARRNPHRPDGDALTAWCASDESYAVLDETSAAGSSWMAGACVLLAKAIRKAYPDARLVGIETPDGIQHVGAEIGDVVLDALGGHSSHSWEEDWLAYEQLPANTPVRVVSLKGVPRSELPDAESPATPADVALVARALP